MADILFTCWENRGASNAADCSSMTHLGSWVGSWPVEDVIGWIEAGIHTCFIVDGSVARNVVVVRDSAGAKRLFVPDPAKCDVSLFFR